MTQTSREEIRETLTDLLVNNVSKSITADALRAPLIDLLDTFVSREDGIYQAPEPTGNPTTDTANLDAYFKALATSGRVGLIVSQYSINGTIAPAGQFVCHAGPKFQLTADPNGTYTEVLESPLGETTQIGSGVDVVFDTSGCGGSVLSGDWFLLSGSLGGGANLANRANIPSNLCAITAATTNSEEMIWERLTVQGFGYGFFQGDFRGTGSTILPYTRLQIRQLTIRFCNTPIQTGQSGNGFDDASIDILRMSRNFGNTTLRGSDLAVVSWFNLGLDADLDIEPQTLATTAGVAAATLSAANALIVVGTVLAISGAGLNKDGGPIDHVTRVTAKVGTTLTLETAPEVTVAAAAIVANPPTTSVSTFNLNVRHLYLEGTWDSPIRMGSNAGLVTDDLKVSAGGVSARLGAIILTVGTEAMVDVTCNFRTASSDLFKTLIGFGMVKDVGASVDAAILCRVKEMGRQGDFTETKEAFTCVQLPASLRGSYTDASGDTLAINAVVDFSDASVTYLGTLGTNAAP